MKLLTCSFLCLALCVCSCVSHMPGSFPYSIPTHQGNVQYVGAAVGYGKTTSIFMIGGNSSAGLNAEAKQSLVQSTRLQPGQYLDNITSDVRTTWILPWRKREVILTADVAQTDNGSTIGLSGDYKNLKPGFLNIGDSVRFILLDNIAGGRVLRVGEEMVTVSLRDAVTSRLKIRNVHMSRLFRFRDIDQYTARLNFKVGDQVRLKSGAGSRSGIVMGINNSQKVLVKPFNKPFIVQTAVIAPAGQ